MKVKVCYYTSTVVEVNDSFQKFVCNEEEYYRRWRNGEIDDSDVYNLIDEVDAALLEKGIESVDIDAIEDVATEITIFEN
jgi:hypothetical protein